MVTLTSIASKLNSSKLGLFFSFDANESENIMYIVKSSEAVFDSELDREIEHLARYNSAKDGDFQGWVCKDASLKVNHLISALNRYWTKKQATFNMITVQ